MSQPKGKTVIRYKLDFSETSKTRVIRRTSRKWAITVVASVFFMTFALLFFGGLGTAFRYRDQHLSLREQHDSLRLRYDSLYAAKLEADRKLVQMQGELKLLQQTP